MKDIADAVSFVRENLGPGPGRAFAAGVEDFLCSVRHSAVSLLPREDPERDFRMAAADVIADAVKAFVAENYVSMDGRLEIHVSSNDFLDKAMMPIPEISAIRGKSEAIIDAVSGAAMSEHRKGRELGAEIAGRARTFEEKFIGPMVPRLPAPPRPPPLEVLEIEMMRLERKLPELSKDEGNRLSQLYVLLKVTAKAH
jgi:hypothetical protein